MLTRAYLTKAEALVRQAPDMELTVVVPPMWREPRVGSVRLEAIRPQGYSLEVVPIIFNGHHHIFVFRGLNKIIYELQPDILHIDEEPFNMATFLAALSGKTVCKAMLFYSWANIKKRLPPPFSLFRKAVYSWCKGALAGNAEAAQLLLDTGYEGVLDIVPQFGVDLELFPFRERQLNPPYRVGYMGRLVPEKGVDLLLSAVAASTLPMEVVIVGSGKAKAALEQQAVRLAVDSRVRFLRPVSSEEVGHLMGGFHVLVLPSRTTPKWKEQFGRVLAEAMATGCVVIGSTSGEIPNVIGDAGLVFPEGDALALRDRLETILSSPGLYSDLACKARARATELFSQDAIAARHLRFYRRLAAKPETIDPSPGRNA
jgi:glycosyltransferase involved in cell wall biosynthesis